MSNIINRLARGFIKSQDTVVKHNLSLPLSVCFLSVLFNENGGYTLGCDFLHCFLYSYSSRSMCLVDATELGMAKAKEARKVPQRARILRKLLQSISWRHERACPDH